MNPVSFPEQNILFARDQAQYHPLSAHRDADGRSTSCWHLSWRERVRVLFTGRVWHQMLTFHRAPMPIKLLTEKPELLPVVML